MKYFIKSLQFIFKPHYWIMNKPFNDKWDKKLNLLMNEYNFEYISGYTARLGGYEIWVENHPYSSFTLYPKAYYRPSRLTIQKAMKKYQNDVIDKIYDN